MNDSQPNKDVATLKLELELEKLEREWLQEKERHLTSGGGDLGGGWIRTGLGPAHPGLGIIGGIIVIVMGLFLLSNEMSDVGVFAIVAGIVTLVIAAAMLWNQVQKSQTHSEAEQKYLDRRQELLRDIAASKAQSNAGGNTGKR